MKPNIKQSLHDIESHEIVVNNAHIGQEDLDNILTSVTSFPITLLIGSVGCGKTTRVPKYFLNTRRFTNILYIGAKFPACTYLYSVLYDTTFKDRVSMKAGMHTINAVTNPIFTIYTESSFRASAIYADRDLGIVDKYDLIILDDVHSTTGQFDVILAYLAHCLSITNKSRLLIMSATISTESFNTLARNCNLDINTISHTKSAYPVTDYDPVTIALLSETFSSTVTELKNENNENNDIRSFMERVETIKRGSDSLIDNVNALHQYVTNTNFKYPKSMRNTVMGWITSGTREEFAAEIALAALVRTSHNRVIIFVPGWQSMLKVKKLTMRFCEQHNIRVVLAHAVKAPVQASTFSSHILNPILIISTNVLEDGVNIPYVKFAIDLGVEHRKIFLEDLHAEDLVEVVCTISSHVQRLGRAGRECRAFGVCVAGNYGDPLLTPAECVEELLALLTLMPRVDSDYSLMKCRTYLTAEAQRQCSVEDFNSAVKVLQNYSLVSGTRLTELGDAVVKMSGESIFEKLARFSSFFLDCAYTFNILMCALTSHSYVAEIMTARSEIRDRITKYVSYQIPSSEALLILHVTLQFVATKSHHHKDLCRNFNITPALIPPLLQKIEENAHRICNISRLVNLPLCGTNEHNEAALLRCLLWTSVTSDFEVDIDEKNTLIKYVAPAQTEKQKGFLGSYILGKPRRLDPRVPSYYVMMLSNITMMPTESIPTLSICSLIPRDIWQTSPAYCMSKKILDERLPDYAKGTHRGLFNLIKSYGKSCTLVAFSAARKNFNSLLINNDLGPNPSNLVEIADLFLPIHRNCCMFFGFFSPETRWNPSISAHNQTKIAVQPKFCDLCHTWGHVCSGPRSGTNCILPPEMIKAIDERLNNVGSLTGTTLSNCSKCHIVTSSSLHDTSSSLHDTESCNPPRSTRCRVCCKTYPPGSPCARIRYQDKIPVPYCIKISADRREFDRRPCKYCHLPGHHSNDCVDWRIWCEMNNLTPASAYNAFQQFYSRTFLPNNTYALSALRNNLNPPPLWIFGRNTMFQT